MPTTSEHVTRPRRLSAWRPAALAIVIPLAVACGTKDFQTSGPTDPDELYWELALDHHAVTLATSPPYDTLTVVAVPRNAVGAPVAGLPAATYVSQDPTKITVTPDGLLQVVEPSAEPVWVVATLTTAGVTHRDSMRVRGVETADRPVLATFSVQPTQPDSAKIAMGWVKPLMVHAADESGQPMTDLMVAFRTSDRQTATIDPMTGEIVGTWYGNVTFYASTTMFGVSKTDSVKYRVGAPIMYLIVVPPPEPGTNRIPDFGLRTVGVGALVAWAVQSLDAPGFALEFDEDDLPNVQAANSYSEWVQGNVESFCTWFRADCTAAGNVVVSPPTTVSGFRVFTAPGVYDYRCKSCGGVGRIVVVDERSH